MEKFYNDGEVIFLFDWASERLSELVQENELVSKLFSLVKKINETDRKAYHKNKLINSVIEKLNERRKNASMYEATLIDSRVNELASKLVDIDYKEELLELGLVDSSILEVFDERPFTILFEYAKQTEFMAVKKEILELMSSSIINECSISLNEDKVTPAFYYELKVNKTQSQLMDEFYSDYKDGARLKSLIASIFNAVEADSKYRNEIDNLRELTIYLKSYFEGDDKESDELIKMYSLEMESLEKRVNKYIYEMFSIQRDFYGSEQVLTWGQMKTIVNESTCKEVALAERLVARDEFKNWLISKDYL